MPWGPTPVVYTLPTIRITVAGAGWLADAAVTSWSVDRELVASVVPGTLRSRNGLSVGAASVNVVNSGPRVTPWSTDPDRAVVLDSAVSLFAEDGVGDTLPLGAWVLDPAAGSLNSRETSIDLLEAQYAGRGAPATILPHEGPVLTPGLPIDPIWVIGQLVERAGFPSVPPAVESTLVAAPLFGHTRSTGGTSAYSAGGIVSEWQVLPGDTAIGPVDGSYVLLSASASNGGLPVTDRLRSGLTVFLTLNAVGTVYALDYATNWQIEIINNLDTGTFSVAACNTATGAFAAAEVFDGQDSNDWPNRVQVELSRTWDAVAEEWASLSVRARSGPSAAWSAWSTDATPSAPTIDGLELIQILGGFEYPAAGIVSPDPGQFAAIQITTEADPALWAAARSYLKPLGGDVGLPWVPAGMDAWAAIQDFCSARLAAAIMGTDGILRILTRDDLAGAGVAGEVIDIDIDATDLPWTIDPKDRVDRIEATFTPPAIELADPFTPTAWGPIAWTAAEVIHVPPLTTITIRAEFENTASSAIYRRFKSPDSGLGTVLYGYSSVRINALPDGTGGTPFDPVGINARSISATLAEITVRNFSGSSVYLAEADGSPSLKLRASTVARYDTAQVVERGLSADLATQPLAIDLTPWVQTASDAATIADYLWSRLSTAGLWRASGIRVRLDWSLDIGQIRQILHAATGLLVKVLVTKVHYDGNPGEIAQTIDVVLLPVTWADFDALALVTPALDTWTDFDASYSGRTWADFDANPLWNGP